MPNLTPEADFSRFFDFAVRAINPINLMYSPRDLNIKVEPHGTSGVCMEWFEGPSVNLSKILISFATNTEASEEDSYHWRYKPTIALSDIEAGDNYDGKPEPPFDGLRVVLTLLATLQEFSKQTNPIIHIVRANRKSLPLFRKLKELGLYHWCDSSGNPSEEIIEWDNYLTSGYLFAAQYPQTHFPDLQKFAPPPFVKKLVSFYKESTKNLPEKDDVKI